MTSGPDPSEAPLPSRTPGSYERDESFWFILAVHDVGDGAVFFEVDVEAVLDEVLGDHHAGLDDAGLLGQIPLAEDLAHSC